MTASQSREFVAWAVFQELVFLAVREETLKSGNFVGWCVALAVGVVTFPAPALAAIAVSDGISQLIYSDGRMLIALGGSGAQPYDIGGFIDTPSDDSVALQIVAVRPSARRSRS